nr:hypothetical protein StreXyl84_44870 [Streptomyces sp. Xyl84]
MFVLHWWENDFHADSTRGGRRHGERDDGHTGGRGDTAHSGCSCHADRTGLSTGTNHPGRPGHGYVHGTGHPDRPGHGYVHGTGHPDRNGHGADGIGRTAPRAQTSHPGRSGRCAGTSRPARAPPLPPAARGFPAVPLRRPARR